ncbi:MAG: hypothetical protein O2854_06825, partial [Chloroflexi bacterium]|nr:hypothetical protein [Chloroflexota bacterium]
SNFLDKWVHRFVAQTLWLPESEQGRLQLIQNYFELSEAARQRSAGLARLSVQQEPDAVEAASLTAELQSLNSDREGKRAAVEEVLESTISSVVAGLGMASVGGFIFPPVDIRLTEPPKLLVTSPRDKILRAGDVLLSSDITTEASVVIENTILQEENLSALVTGIGGLATYPAFVLNDRSLRFVLQLGAHEWVHHYLAFRPLGQTYFKNGDMQTLNETFADIAGREIGDLAYLLLGGHIEPSAESVITEDNQQQENPAQFDFNSEMRQTRTEVDRLLEEGRIEEAEAYMEQQRLLFVENGYLIRKLNQAYFAFYGTYAESPTSSSPIGEQMREFRRLSGDLTTFMQSMAGISTYAEFLGKLEQLQDSAAIHFEDLPFFYQSAVYTGYAPT